MIKQWEFTEAKDRKIWIPHMCDAAFPFAAVLRGKGYDAEVLPRSDDRNFTLGRKHTDGDQCLPSIITTEDMLTRALAKDFQPDREAFFQGSSDGPCRFGRYFMNQLLIFQHLGLESVPIVTLSNQNFYGGLGTNFKLFAWDGILGQGMLERMLHFTRPFETNPGDAERVYKNALDDFCKALETGIREKGSKPEMLLGIHNKDVLASLKKSYEKFMQIKMEGEEKPVVFVTGEIYVRTSDVANQDLVRKIEKHGGIALLEPAASFFSYTIASKMERRKHHVRDLSLKDAIKYFLELQIVERDGRKIEHIFHQHDPSAWKVIEHGSRYVHPTFEGEAIVTMGGCDYFASRTAGIINVMPHNCMPGTICTALSRDLKQNFDIPFLNLSYDGHVDPNREDQIEVFMYQVRERFRKK